MKTKWIIITANLLLFAGALGCRTEGAYLPQSSQRLSLENRERIVLLDRDVQRSIATAGFKERKLEDGRLEVTVNLRNRLRRRIQVQANCVFKDEQGFSTGDETPFQNLILSESAQESLTFVSLNARARKYTIRIRQAR